MNMYIGPASLTGEDGVRRIGSLTLPAAGRQDSGGWHGSFRPNGANPIGPGNAMLQIGGRAAYVRVLGWQASASAGGNAIVLGQGDWPF